MTSQFPQADPYAPPKSSLGGLTPAEQAARDGGVLVYAELWRRVAALVIDCIVLSPMLLLDYFFGGQTRMFELYVLVPDELFGLYLYIYMVVTYGGTPGKLLLGLRITRIDGSAPTVKDAFLRYGVLWLLALAVSTASIVAALGMSDQAYLALGYGERAEAFEQRVPFIGVLDALMLVWLVGCIISVVVSKQRRALHDFIAGTVVVRR